MNRKLLVVGLGEALYDCFPNGQVLGGAPVNFAVHANALLAPGGGKAVAATRVGDDALGKSYLEEIRARGLDTSAVQQDPAHPTGTVDVRIDSAGNASYIFASDVAWDYLDFTNAFGELARECHAVSFGTLAQRSDQSRLTIQAFLGAATQALRLFDVNLRQGFFDVDSLEEGMRLATSAKLNEDELEVLTGVLELKSSNTDGRCLELCRRYDLHWLALTRGPRGTLLYSGDDRYEGEERLYPRAADADTVGAGDACGAGLVCGQLWGWSLQRTVDLANAMGAYVASRPGATPPLDASIQALAPSGD